MAIVLIYLAGFGLIAFLAGFFYSLSVRSRKRYTCPSCGERIQTEHLDASHCSFCGTPLERRIED